MSFHLFSRKDSEAVVLVITDMMMPGVDGFVELKAKRYSPLTSVIIFTGSNWIKHLITVRMGNLEKTGANAVTQ